MKIVSACLAGVCCRYDGESKPCEKVINLVKAGKAIPVCPEQLWWLATPRIAAEMQENWKIIRKDWIDVTKEYKKWAEETLKIAKLIWCKEAILKSKSPSCWCWEIYDGSFEWNLKIWDGICAKLLKDNWIKYRGFRDLTLSHSIG